VKDLAEKSKEQSGSYLIEFNTEQGKVYELLPLL
jgi:hypothetical protein